MLPLVPVTVNVELDLPRCFAALIVSVRGAARQSSWAERAGQAGRESGESQRDGAAEAVEAVTVTV